VILDVYPARENAADFPGVSGLLVAEATADAAGGKRVAWMRTHAAAEAFLRNELCSGDLLLTMGAGDVDRVGRSLLSGGAGGAEAPPI
jgi:UDP-N-acetylmuramate--alanine ligase